MPGFDIAFLNAELKRAAKPLIVPERVVDRLVLARRKHAGGDNTLETCPSAMASIAPAANTARCSTPSC